MTQRTLTLKATNAVGNVSASAVVTIADAPPGPTDFTFMEGTPASVDVSSLIDPAATRTQGGFFYEKDPYDGQFFTNLWFDPQKKTLDYDGSPLNIYANRRNPNSSYWIGSEVGPHNTNWQWPPTIMPIPPPTLNGTPLVQGGNKHTRPRFSALDGLIHILGGDYGTPWIADGHQDGRMMFPNLNPVTNTWGMNYPMKGRAGEDQPLSPDIMGVSESKKRKLWWITWGDARAGVPANSPADDPTAIAAQCWSSLGGLSTAWPKSCTTGGSAPYLDEWPLFVFDQVAKKYIRLANQPWRPASIQMRENACDDVADRVYKMMQFGNGIRLFILDTRLYETNPMAMPWSNVDIDLRAGQPNNLTGTGKYATCWGVNFSPLNIDETKRVLYFIDSRNCAVLALTLQGHSQGEHKVLLVADLSSYMKPLDAWVQGYLAAASMPVIWCAEIRKLVLLREPIYHQAGPETTSLTIDVDSGAVSNGPRLPSRVNGLPWFPGAGCWIPTTKEVFLYGCYNDLYGTPTFAKWGATPGTTAIQEMYRYKWGTGTAPTQVKPWSWKRLTITMIPKSSALMAKMADGKSGPKIEEDHQ